MPHGETNREKRGETGGTDGAAGGVSGRAGDGVSHAEELRPPRLPDREVETRLVDARRFLELTSQLRELYDRVDAAKVSVEQKGRWQRRLIAITNAAKDDMDRAEGHLVRFTAELDRHLRR